MEIKNAVFKEIELPNGKIARVNNEVELKPHGRAIIEDIILENGEIKFYFNNKTIVYNYDYFIKNATILFNESHEVKLTLGDWSDDGHGEYESFGIISNYDVSALRKAYKDSCKLTGITFNHNDDYTGLLKGEYGHWRQLFTEYESCEIEPEACKILETYGLIDKDDWDEEENGGIAMDPDDVAYLIMKFIALSMPEDFTYTFSNINLNTALPINGWWNSELNVQFGYGLYD